MEHYSELKIINSMIICTHKSKLDMLPLHYMFCLKYYCLRLVNELYKHDTSTRGNQEFDAT